MLQRAAAKERAASAASCTKAHSQRLQLSTRTKRCHHPFSIHLKHKNQTVKKSQYVPKTVHQHKKYCKTYSPSFLWDLTINSGPCSLHRLDLTAHSVTFSSVHHLHSHLHQRRRQSPLFFTSQLNTALQQFLVKPQLWSTAGQPFCRAAASATPRQSAHYRCKTGSIQALSVQKTWFSRSQSSPHASLWRVDSITAQGSLGGTNTAFWDSFLSTTHTHALCASSAAHFRACFAFHHRILLAPRYITAMCLRPSCRCFSSPVLTREAGHYSTSNSATEVTIQHKREGPPSSMTIEHFSFRKKSMKTAQTQIRATEH